MKRVVVATAALAALVLANTLRLELHSERAHADVGRLLELSTATLQVAEGGRFNRQTLVLLHGLGGSIQWWNTTAPGLARDHRVIRIDLLGHGGSDKPRTGYSIEEQAAVVAEALRELHAENVTLVGHSLGGLVATAVAETDPFAFRGLVLISTPADPNLGNPSAIRRLVFTPVLGHTIYSLTPASVLRGAGMAAFSDGIQAPLDLLSDITRMTYNSASGSRRAGDLFMRSEPGLIARLRELELPILVIWGDSDSLWPAAAFKDFEQLPMADVRVIAGVGHSPQVEAPREVERLIRDLTHADWY